MSPAEKWNAIATRVDPILALLIFGLGLAGILLRKKAAAGRAARVTVGELSTEQANSNAKIVDRCSYAFLGIGVFLIAMEILGM